MISLSVCLACAVAPWTALIGGFPSAQTFNLKTPRDEARIFLGNSLLHHLTDSDETSVSYQISLMAQQDGRSFSADERWGYPRNFADELPPRTNWEFAEVNTVWDYYHQPFVAAGFDTKVLDLETYIPSYPADRPYQGDNPDGATPPGAILKMLDWVIEDTDAPQFQIYEGWADLRHFLQEFPLIEPKMRQYYVQIMDTGARWYYDYVTELDALRLKAGSG